MINLPGNVKVLRLSEEDARKIADSLWYRHADNTVIAVAQDHDTKDVLMVASMNRDAVIKTLTTGMVHYWSLSRRTLWLKGETSGHYQYLITLGLTVTGGMPYSYSCIKSVMHATWHSLMLRLR